MRATDFEFRNRFWIFGLLYFAGFVPYRFHDENALVSILNRLAPQIGDRGVRVAFFITAAIMLLAALFRTWATAYLSTEIMKHSEVQSATLVADGPYRHVRNPLYLGNILMTLSFGAMASRIGAVIVIVGVITFILRLIGREEAQLGTSQGESFRRFCAAVPRLVPSLTPRVAASGRPPRWGQAFAGESMMWGFVLTVVIFAATLRTGAAFFIALTLSIASNFFFRGRLDKANAAGSAK